MKVGAQAAPETAPTSEPAPSPTPGKQTLVEATTAPAPAATSAPPGQLQLSDVPASSDPDSGTCTDRPRRVYFTIAYDVEAFVVAADTYAASVQARPDFDATYDELKAYVVVREADLHAAWQSLAALGGDGAHVIQEGKIFSHASKGSSRDGLEFKEGDQSPHDDGTLSGDDIMKLPRLNWAADGELGLSSCNSGLEEDRGWSPAQLFASRQGVTTLGELGVATFSTSPDTHEGIGEHPDEAYLAAYARGKNDKLGDGSRIPAIAYEGGKELPAGARPKPEGNTETTTLFVTANGIRVVNDFDAGAFYCEHVFYVTSAAAAAADSSIVTDPMGEPLVGFLHVPGKEDRPGSADRHAATIEVTAAALRGYVDAARGKAGGDVRILVTGFEDWDGIDNPTGDYVNDPSKIDAAMSGAFGVSIQGNIVLGTDRISELVYDLPDGTRVTIRTQVLAVNASAIDGGASSAQQAIASFQPHAILSLGVSPSGTAFQAESVATAASFDWDGGITDASGIFVNSYALARAIQGGAEAIEQAGVK